MSTSTQSNIPDDLPADLVALTHCVQTAAQQREGDCLALLQLLRLLDELHYNIRDTLFREALPDNRQRLYRLLKDIEQQKGWPHISRMRLSDLLEHLQEEASSENQPSEGTE